MGIPGMGADSPSLVVVVDVANVMGSRADGWWRDRAGAALRLYGEIAELAGRVPETFVLVLEGRSVEAAARISVPHPSVRVISAAGSGDDSIVTETAALVACGVSCLVVTADRELRRRCAAEGADVVGPSWLLGQL